MRQTSVLSLCAVGVIALFATGCQKSPPAATDQTSTASAPAPATDTSSAASAPAPADGNLAAPTETAQNSAPASASAPADQGSYPDYDSGGASDVDTEPAEYAPQPPPELPDYSQPPCPGDDYMWTPGYWDHSSSGYYWVPGAWVVAPYVGALWTPPYWAFSGGRYRLHRGYWAPHIGFYGGVNYGFGYTGRGYYGGYWNDGRFDYNRSVTNVNVSVIHNVYNQTVRVENNTRVSYNGGNGGINLRPIPAEQAVLREHRTPPVAAQVQHVRQAASTPAQFARGNQARPTQLAVARPLPTSYHSPAPAPAGVAPRAAGPGGRPANAPEGRPTPEARATPGARQPAPAERPNAQPGRNEPARPAPQPTNQPRPEARPNAPAQPRPENRPAPAPARPESRPAPAPARPETRPAPAPARPESRPAPAPARPETRPAPAPARPETRPAPAPARPEARPAPTPARPEGRPAPAPAKPEARPAPAARPESKPAAPAHNAPPARSNAKSEKANTKDTEHH